MHIVSASRRTDIPAFHSRWFAERLRAGFVRVQNPFSKADYEVSLRPEDVVAIVFWTRNPLPLLRCGFEEVKARGIPACFHFTITGYDRVLERSTLSAERALEAFRRVSDEVGPEFVQWRYDPVVETDRTDWDWHLKNFERLAAALEGRTRRCYFSFVQLYRKTRLRMEEEARREGFRYRFRGIRKEQTARSELGTPYSSTDMLRRSEELASLAKAHGITLYTCCDDSLINPENGIRRSHCIDLDIIRALVKDPDLIRKPRPTREDCGCVESRDIGAYNTCAFGCVYCYAVSDPEKAAAAVRKAHETSSRLE